MYICVSGVCVCLCVCVQAHAKAGPYAFFTHLPPYFWDRYSLTLKLTGLNRLAGQQAWVLLVRVLSL